MLEGCLHLIQWVELSILQPPNNVDPMLLIENLDNLVFVLPIFDIVEHLVPFQNLVKQNFIS